MTIAAVEKLPQDALTSLERTHFSCDRIAEMQSMG